MYRAHRSWKRNASNHLSLVVKKPSARDIYGGSVVESWTFSTLIQRSTLSLFKMSDSESEQENEITFRSSLHHGVGLPSSQPEQEGPCLTDGPRKKNSAMSAIDGQSRDDHVYSKNQGSSQTWMENAVKDMVKHAKPNVTSITKCN